MKKENLYIELIKLQKIKHQEIKKLRKKIEEFEKLILKSDKLKIKLDYKESDLNILKESVNYEKFEIKKLQDVIIGINEDIKELKSMLN